MNNAFTSIAVVVALAIIWRVWVWIDDHPRKQYHYPVRWDGTHATCKCGHNSVTDYNLQTHFEETGRVGK